MTFGLPASLEENRSFLWGHQLLPQGCSHCTEGPQREQEPEAPSAWVNLCCEIPRGHTQGCHSGFPNRFSS